MKCKKLLSLALAVCMTFGSAAVLPQNSFIGQTDITASAASTATSGSCGDDAYWTLNDGVLTISGIGSIKDSYPSQFESIAKQISSVVIEDGISRIGVFAFYNCNSIESVVIPESVISIGACAFSRCSNLEEIVLPNGLTKIDNGVFTDCICLGSISIPNGVSSIGSQSFLNCRSLESITLSNNLNEIGNGAFGGCSSLNNVVIPSSVNAIGEGAFSSCTSLKSISIPESITIIESRTFSSCSNLETISLPIGLTKIDNNAFSGCNKLTSISIPKTVTTIGSEAFYLCYGLSAVTIPIGVKEIKSKAFNYCRELKEVTIPASVTSIKNYAFGYIIGYDNHIQKVNGFSINCYQDSEAEKYAIDNGFSYNIIKCEHNFNDWNVDKASTCTEEGEKSRVCSICGKTETQKIIALGHNYVKTEVSPTCTSKGYTNHKCSRCGDSYKDTYKAALGHTWSKWTTTKKATCTADGSKTKTCSVCKKTETATIAKLRHDYAATVVKPTCTKQGYTLHKCSRCGDSYKDTYKSALGHTWSKWTTTKAATCTADGSKTRTCSVCKKTETATIAKLGHSYKATVVKPTCSAKGYTLHKCSRCGDNYKDTYKDATGHSWSKWTTTKKATCTAAGSKTRTCSVCKKTETATIAKLGHDYAATVVKPTCTKQGYTLHKCSRCGDSYNDTYTNTVAHKVTNWTTKSFNVDKGTSIQTGKCTHCGKVQTRTVNNAVVRYAGANRYDTAAMLSKASHKTTSDTVIIADAMTFQDALIAVPLAKAYNAPLLLANPNTVTKQTEAELARLKAKKVIIVNTSNALKSGTIYALKKKYTTQIINGSNCFETSKRVAEELQKKTKKAPTDVFFTTNKAFADALSISPVAALKGAPILYVDPSKKTLDSNILAYLNKVKGSIKNVYIVGGTVAVPKAIENSIKKALPKKNVKRFDGAQRYETCVMINKYFASLLNSKTVCVAKGLDFPDALAGGVFAANQKAPLLLADSALRDAQKSFLKNKKPNKLYIFGGKVAVPDKLAKEVAKMSV